MKDAHLNELLRSVYRNKIECLLFEWKIFKLRGYRFAPGYPTLACKLKDLNIQLNLESRLSNPCAIKETEKYILASC